MLHLYQPLDPSDALVQGLTQAIYLLLTLRYQNRFRQEMLLQHDHCTELCRTSVKCMNLHRIKDLAMQVSRDKDGAV